MSDSKQVDVIGWFDDFIRNGPEIYEDDASDVRAAVAELIEAGKEMRLCLRVLRDDCQAEPEDLAALRRADAALANCAPAKGDAP